MFHHFTQSFSTFAIVAIGITYAVVSILVAPNQPRHKTDSNKRAMMRSCPPSSALTVGNCSRPRQMSHPAAETAVPSGPCASMPGPSATPHSVA